jgi:hypothetical protein
MNPRYMPVNSATPFLVASNEGQAPDVKFLGDFQDLCSFGMDQAIEIGKASLATYVHVNSCVLDIYKNASYFTPVFGNLLDVASQALAFSLELQMNWLTALAPHGLSHVEIPGSTVAGNSGRRDETTEEGLAHSMDIATGARFVESSSKATGRSGPQDQQAAKDNAAEDNMYIAVGARAS